MRTTTVAHKYAKALFDASIEAERTQKVAAGMASIRHLKDEEPAFLNFLTSPEVLTEHKSEFIRTVFAPRLDEMTVNFLRLLVDKKRIDLLPEICADFQLLVEEHQGLLRAPVTTAVPLNADQEARLKHELDRLTGKDVILEQRVDPAILGGVIVFLGTQIIDRSLRRGLERMAENLLQAEVS
jgi:F-type H+-transporting ATPase subunit delta